MTRTLYDPMGAERAAAQAREQARFEHAVSLLDVLDDETIAFKLGLKIETVRQLRRENS